MAASFEKSVKGATKVKLAPPKIKYIEHILIATHAGDAGVGEIFRVLQFRMRDSAWTTVFKSLTVVHLMIRDGEPNVTLNYLAKHRNVLATTVIDAQTQGRNIRHYANYLTERGRAYRDTKCDWVRVKETRLEKLSVDKGLLRETEAVQHQLTALLKCDVMEEDSGNEITVFVFRLLVLDCLALFQALNQAMINILGHFFEMSKVDAERAMEIYLNFTRQTDFVVQYLSIARQYEHQTHVEVPKLKHAPVNLGRQLEDYLHDPDFETHRRQYLAELSAKKSGGSSRAAKPDFGAKSTPARSNTTTAKPASTSAKPAQPAKGPDPDLIDFFGAIEQNQTPMAVQPGQQPGQQQQMQTGLNPWGVAMPNNGMAAGMFTAQPTGVYQQNGFMPQQQTGFQSTNPFQVQATGAFAQPQVQVQPQQQQQQQQPLQPAYTGVGFGGYTPQPQPQPQQPSFQPGGLSSIPQNSVASFPPQQPQQQQQQQLQLQQQQFLQPQQQSSQPGFAPAQIASPTGQTTNPFRQSMLMSSAPAGGFQSAPTTSTAFVPAQAPAPLVPQQTSTNPFARSSPQAGQQQQQPFSTPAPLVAAKTGTNPFARDYGGGVAAQRPVTAGGISAATATSLAPQPTGTTNPFRQTAFVNHQTGLGWQHQQPTGNLLDQVETVPVFPRPAPQAPWQQ